MTELSPPGQARPGPAARLRRAAEGLWHLADRHPLAVFGALLALQVLPGMQARHLWPDDEMRHAAVFWEMVAHGNWFALHMNGAFYPDKPPLHFWLLAGLSMLTGSREPWVFFLGTGIGAALVMVATWRLARVVAPAERGLAVAALFALSGTQYFLDRVHFPRMDLLFVAFMALSLASLIRAAVDDWPGGAAAWGLVWATLSALTKGPLGFLPVVAFLLVIAASGRWRRLATRPVALGLGASALLVGGYVAGTWAEQGWAYMRAVFGYVDARDGLAEGTAGNLGRYLGWMAPAWLPFTLLALLVPWRAALAGLRSGRAASGWVMVALFVALALAVLAAMDYAMPRFRMIFLAPLAVVTAGILWHLPRGRVALFAGAVGALLIPAGVALPILSARPDSGFIVPHSPLQGALAVICGVALVMLWRARAGLRAVLPVLAVGAGLMMLPHVLLTYPATGSPDKAAFDARLRGLIAQGVQPYGFGLRGQAGHYQYPARSRILQLADRAALVATLAGPDPAVALMPRAAWEGWANRPEAARVLAATRLRTGRYTKKLDLVLVALRDPG